MSETVDAYLDYPTNTDGPKAKREFRRAFKLWADHVRHGADIAVTAESVGGEAFADQIRIMTHPASLRSHLMTLLKNRNPVQFHVRTEDGKKIWFTV